MSVPFALHMTWPFFCRAHLCALVAMREVWFCHHGPLSAQMPTSLLRPAERISMLTTYNGQRALLQDVVERRCSTHPAFGRPHRVSGTAGCLRALDVLCLFT